MAISITVFPASAYSPNSTAMNASFGFGNSTIHGFSTARLPAGFSITISGGNVATTTWTQLPALLSQNGGCGAVGSRMGDFYVGNLGGNVSPSCTNPGNISRVIEFSCSPGASSIGIGLASFQSTNPPSPQYPITNHDLLVNGVNLGQIELLAGANWSPGMVRNAYLRIDASGGEEIHSVAFVNRGSLDVLLLSDLAIYPIDFASGDAPLPLWSLCL